MALWLEIIRILLGVLILLAIASLYGLFKKTKVRMELHIVSAGFLLYTVRSVLSIYTSYTGIIPSIWSHLTLEDFLSACIYLIFAYAVIRLQKIFNVIRVEKKLVKTLNEILG